MAEKVSAVSVGAEYASLESLRTRIATHREFSEFPDDVHAVVGARLPSSRNFRLLDVGCGTGDFLRRLRADGHHGRLVGLDTSAEAVFAARSIPDAEGVLGSATELDFADGTFDVVTARHMLYHVDEPDRALREFRRVLDDGGVCITLVNHPETAPNVMALVRGVARELGLEPPTTGFNDVHSDNLPEMMEAVFGSVRVDRHDNALVFAEPEPLIAFAVAVFSFCGIEPGAPIRAQAIASVDRAVREWFERNAGPWRDPKGYTLCTAYR